MKADYTFPNFNIRQVKCALAGVIGFKLLFLLVLAHKRNVFQSPTEVGHACRHCGHFVNLNEISRRFNPRPTRPRSPAAEHMSCSFNERLARGRSARDLITNKRRKTRLAL